MRTRINRIGSKYGRLTAIAETQTGKRSTHLWRCECGTEKEILTYNVVSGHVVSCGCYQKELLTKNASLLNRKPDGVAAFNHVYRNYKARANNRNMIFTLTEDQFKSIITKPCSYCGIEPSQEFASYKAKNSGVFLYNGVDRIDSNLGYVDGNVVPCCWICNRAKGELSTEKFLEWSKRVYEHNNT